MSLVDILPNPPSSKSRNFSKAYQRGFLAAQAGQSVNANPYQYAKGTRFHPGNQYYRYWLKGFTDFNEAKSIINNT